jgi:hypothetical protein
LNIACERFRSNSSNPQPRRRHHHCKTASALIRWHHTEDLIGVTHSQKRSVDLQRPLAAAGLGGILTPLSRLEVIGSQHTIAARIGLDVSTTMTIF